MLFYPDIVKLLPYTHNLKRYIVLSCTSNPLLLNIALSNQPEFTKSKKGNWSIINTKASVDCIFRCFRGKAWVDASIILGEMKKVSGGVLKKKPRTKELSPAAEVFLENFYRFLEGKRYSGSTVSVYGLFVKEFVSFVTGYKKFRDVTNKDFHLFCEDVLFARRYSISSQRQFVSALKQLILFAPELVLTADILYSPEKDKKLPCVLSQQEVISIIRACKNLKHRAALAMMYASGLRVGELLSLKLYNISFDRNQIIVQNAKGRKDRVVVMAESIMPLVHSYLDAYAPKEYFLEGADGGMYSSSSVRKFLKVACSSVGVNKPVTPHTLRHSYATHMLENGVDLRYIQELLGHARPETTMIYTHVARKDLLSIKSPLDVAVERMKSDKAEQNFRLSRKGNAK
jgi:site-specific recombinase XerD